MSIDKRISEFDIIEEFDITTKIPIIQGSPLKNGIITPKDFTKSIADDMLIELKLDNVDNTSDIDKPISTATKTYVDNKVKTDVPADAKFTDTIYTHPASHPASMITESTTKRFVTDAEKSTWTNKETPEGAQTKANKALTDATAYVDEQIDIVNEQIDIINDKQIPIITLTGLEYHNLNPKDPNTFYFIKED